MAMAMRPTTHEATSASPYKYYYYIIWFFSLCYYSKTDRTGAVQKIIYSQFNAPPQLHDYY